MSTCAPQSFATKTYLKAKGDQRVLIVVDFPLPLTSTLLKHTWGCATRRFLGWHGSSGLVRTPGQVHAVIKAEEVEPNQWQPSKIQLFTQLLLFLMKKKDYARNSGFLTLLYIIHQIQTGLNSELQWAQVNSSDGRQQHMSLCGKLHLWFWAFGFCTVPYGYGNQIKTGTLKPFQQHYLINLGYMLCVWLTLLNSELQDIRPSVKMPSSTPRR